MGPGRLSIVTRLQPGRYRNRGSIPGNDAVRDFGNGAPSVGCALLLQVLSIFQVCRSANNAASNFHENKMFVWMICLKPPFLVFHIMAGL
jgi:hypothetical protein